MLEQKKIAVITGCSSGFGLLSALELAQNGFRVVATMRNLGKRGRLDEAAAREGVADQIDVRPLDVTKFDSHPSFFTEIASEFGRVDCLVNNAGFSLAGFAEDVTLEELREQFETNFFGAVSVTKAALPYMRRQRSGHIIQITSIAGRSAHPGISSYSASKFALEGWTEALRLEMNPLGIRVVLVEPGSFATDIWEANVRIAAQAFDTNSPNHERSLRFRDYVQKKVVKRDARIVARTIAKIANDPEPRLRYLVGPDAKLFRWMTHLVPWKSYEKTVAKTVGI